MAQASGWQAIGARIRIARDIARVTQEVVARRLGIDRSAVMRMEAGERKVSALELGTLATLFDLPLRYFLADPEQSVVSRRSSVVSDDSDAPTRAAWHLDVALDEHARDVNFLAEEGVLPVPLTVGHGKRWDLSHLSAAREAARSVRDRMNMGTGPALALADICAEWGLFVLVVDQDADGASMQLDAAPGYGAAVLGGTRDPGRRRFTAAHELGHHLLGDAYSSDIGVNVTTDERENLINTFAQEFLLPQARLAEELHGVDSNDVRGRLVELTASFRVSWSVAVRVAADGELIDADLAGRLRAQQPTRGDFLAVVGRAPVPDLQIGATSAQWKRAVMAAYKSAAISRPRAVELLHGETTEEDLPARADAPW